MKIFRVETVSVRKMERGGDGARGRGRDGARERGRDGARE